MYSEVFPTQKVYRVLVEAMSHPGRVYSLAASQPSDPWRSPLLAISCTLLDHEVTFAFIGENIILAKEVYSLTRARQAAVKEAHYVIVEGNQTFGQLVDVSCGSSAYPEQGATVIYILGEGLDEPNSQLNNVTLSGPGIKGPLSPQLPGLSVEELLEIHHLNAEYPLGVDCVFLSGDGRIMCLPRSTRIKIQ